jgi:hypothetical protein
MANLLVQFIEAQLIVTSAATSAVAVALARRAWRWSKSAT